jgi:CheY-like chemotaxis protein
LDQVNIENQTRSESTESRNAETRGGSRASLRHSPELILVVDDDQNIREALAEVLHAEQYEVRLAGDGREAIRQFLQGPPDLILLDLNMPDISGWKAFEIMAGLYPYVPVIIITARPGQAARAAHAGIEVLMEKPLDIPTLLGAIRRLLTQPEAGQFSRVIRAWHTRDHPGTQG